VIEPGGLPERVWRDMVRARGTYKGPEAGRRRAAERARGGEHKAVEDVPRQAGLVGRDAEVWSGREQVAVGPGDEFARVESPEDVDDWVWCPMRTSNGAAPRTLGAKYSPSRRVLQVDWARPGLGGGSSRYFDVGPGVWAGYRRSMSPGTFISTTLAGYRFENGDFG
jgi:hypothetical protein